MASLSIEQKVGQVFIFGFPGTDPRQGISLIEEFCPGGIIYFSRNCSTVQDTSCLSSRLQKCASQTGPGIPLFIAADQEGGLVSRLSQDVPTMPGPMALAAAVDDKSLGLVSDVSQAMATQLRAAGINMNLAPVLDVNNNPKNPVIGIRSFGEDPKSVARLGVEAIKGSLSGGIIPVGKHFPGHGNTSVDSHLDLPVVNQSLKELESCELIPFKAAIKAGIPAIMSAHIIFTPLDAQKPATLSYPVLTGLLRNKLKFQGLIITDCMEMNAVVKHVGTANGAVEAFKAGCDLLLVSHTYELQKESYFAVLQGVKSGEISEARLDDSVERILNFKKSFKIPNALPTETAYDRRFKELSEYLHERSITLVKDHNNLVPLRQDKEQTLKLCIVAQESTLLPQTDLVKSLNALHDGLEIAEVLMGDPKAIDKCISSSESVRATIVLSRNAANDEKQADFIRSLIKQVDNVILVATQNPYDISVAPEVPAYICTYGSHREAMDALAKILLGVAKPTGRLPVTIGGL